MKNNLFKSILLAGFFLVSPVAHAQEKYCIETDRPATRAFVADLVKAPIDICLEIIRGTHGISLEKCFGDQMVAVNEALSILQNQQCIIKYSLESAINTKDNKISIDIEIQQGVFVTRYMYLANIFELSKSQ